MSEFRKSCWADVKHLSVTPLQKNKKKKKPSGPGSLSGHCVKGYLACDKQGVTLNEVTAMIPGKGYFKVGGGGRVVRLDLLAFLQCIPKKVEACTLPTAGRRSGSGMSRGFGELKRANLAQGQR